MSKRLNLVLAAVFLVVGILASYNTFALHQYIRETLPRDTAQEACNTKTIAVLKSWIEIRERRDDAMNVRDDAAIAVLNRLVAGAQPSPQELGAWRDAVTADRQIRATADEDRVPIPNC